MILAQGSGCRIVAVALLRHRQADDAHRRIAHRVQKRLRVGRGHQEPPHRADDAHAVSGAGAHVQRVEPVLRPERVRRVGRAQARAADRPAAFAGRKAVVEIDRLVRPLKGADAEMDHADPGVLPVVGRARHVGRQAG